MENTLTQLAAVLAIVISLYALWFNRQIEHEIATQTLIHSQYELCRQLDLLRLDHPEVSHMLPLPNAGDTPWKTYADLRHHVRTIMTGRDSIDNAMRSKLYLKEHATALDVCNIYEQTLLQRDLAEVARDKRRLKVLNELATYYETKMLRSPRMRFHWDNGVSDMMDDKTVKRYDKNVRYAHEGDWADPRSPLDDEPIPASTAAPAPSPAASPASSREGRVSGLPPSA